MVTIALPPDLEKTITERERRNGTTPELLVLETLQQEYGQEVTPAPQAGTLADLLGDYIGCLDSGEVIPGGARMSENIGEEQTMAARKKPLSRVKYMAVGVVLALFLFVLYGCAKYILEGELFNAACSGDTKKVEFLVKIGVDVNCVQEDLNSTPLIGAAYGGHTDTVVVLLRDHPNLKQVGREGTALQIAIDHNYPDIVRLLKAAGATD